MTNTKANMIKVMEAMVENKRWVAEHATNKHLSETMTAEYLAIQEVLNMMQDTEYFEEVAKIYEIQ